MREIATRYDFKGSNCAIERAGPTSADDDLKLKQMQEMIQRHLARRKVDTGAVDFQKPEKATGNTLRQTLTLKQGIDATSRKKIAKPIKDGKLKVQAAIQGDAVRITGKKRDDLQAAIALVRGLKIEQPLQYLNFRE